MVAKSADCILPPLLRHTSLAAWHTHEGLQALDCAFLEHLGAQDPSLLNALKEARASAHHAPPPPHGPKKGALLMALAVAIQDFLEEGFALHDALETLRAEQIIWHPVLWAQKYFIRKKIQPYLKTSASQIPLALPEDLADWVHTLAGHPVDEARLAQKIQTWMQDPEAHTKALENITTYALWALGSPEGQHMHAESTLFHQRKPIDWGSLTFPAGTSVPVHTRYFRPGLTSCPRPLPVGRIHEEAHACLYCHKRSKDTCRTGFPPQNPDASPPHNPLGNALKGCPLQQKISEMNALYAEGHTLAAGIVMLLDNPLAVLTGHRICNDCMKACIFQKQEPIDIPNLESHIMRCILGLPWGVEIYTLLSRWNPLDFKIPFQSAPRPHTVMVAGLGPAGLALSHHLLRAGYPVIALENRPVTPLPSNITDTFVQDFSALSQKLTTTVTGEHLPQGIGGVAEYGITARWEKNALLAVRLMLERHPSFHLYDNTALGRNLSLTEAFALGIDHLALAFGAGKPRFLPLKGHTLQGVHMASDFLMSLHLNLPHVLESPGAFTLKWPVVVIGAGLTAIDAATEARGFYPLQVEKFLKLFTAKRSLWRKQFLNKRTPPVLLEASPPLRPRSFSRTVFPHWTSEERNQAATFIRHGRILRQCPTAEAKDQKLDTWGGVTLVARTALQHTAAYRLNAHEVLEAQKQGVRFQENLTPLACIPGTHGHVTGGDVSKNRTGNPENLHPTGSYGSPGRRYRTSKNAA